MLVSEIFLCDWDFVSSKPKKPYSVIVSQSLLYPNKILFAFLDMWSNIIGSCIYIGVLVFGSAL
jgi:hypothetical protein